MASGDNISFEKSVSKWAFVRKRRGEKIDKSQELQLPAVGHVQEIKKICPQCNEVYNDINRVPKILFDCFHVFCKKCIIRRRKKNYNETGKIFFNCFICDTLYRDLEVCDLKTEYGCILTRPSPWVEVPL